jgi:hypothetical protein
MLDFRGMLEAAIDDGSETLGLENEVFETGCVDTYIVTPDWRRYERVNEIQDRQGIEIDRLGCMMSCKLFPETGG